jgi:deoxyribonuclease-4
MKLGAHVSAAGGLGKAIERAEAIGAETIQIFASSPRSWAFKPTPEAQVEAFRQKAQAAGIAPTFLHGIYLINLGGPPELVRKSIDSLIGHMKVAAQIGAEGVIFHCGSHKGVGFEAILGQAVAALQEALRLTPQEACLIIENSAGMGDHIGASFREIGRLMDAIGSNRVKACLDTEHTFAAGYNLADPDAIEGVMQEFDKEIGLSRLVAVHANDAKVPFGSGVDRHENIGDGHIGTKGFETILSHPAFQDVPFILEVPGPDGSGPDKDNMDRLKAIRNHISK